MAKGTDVDTRTACLTCWAAHRERGWNDQAALVGLAQATEPMRETACQTHHLVRITSKASELAWVGHVDQWVAIWTRMQGPKVRRASK